MSTKKKKSVIVSWVYSYSIILIIPIFAIFINYYSNVKVIRQEIIRANKQVLNNLVDSLDELLEDEREFYSYIYTHEAFKNSLIHQDKGVSFYYEASRLMEKMSTYCMYNGEISCMLYFVDKDYVMNPQGANESDFFYDTVKFYNPSMPDYASWRKMMTKEYINEIIVELFMHHKTNEECIVYADTAELYDSKVNIFISFPVNEIINRVGGMSNGAKLVITINEKMLLTISNGQIIDVDENIQLESKEDFLEIEGYVGLTRESYDKSISYYLLIPEKEFWKEARYTRNVLSISTCFTLLLGCVCVTFLLKRNFQPISSLLKKMGGGEREGNEFFQIEEIYNDLIIKNKSMGERISSQKEIIKRNALLAMMKGRETDHLKTEDIYIPLDKHDKIVLVGFKVPLSDIQLIKHDELVCFALHNVFSELMEGERFYHIEDGQYIYYLFIVSENSKDWKKNYIEKISFICDLMEDKLNIALIAAVSSLDSEIENIRFLYREVIEAFSYKEILGGSGVIDTDILKTASDVKEIGTSIGNKIVMALEKGNYSRMLDMLEQFFINSKKVPLIIFRMQVMGLFQVIAQDFCDFEQNDDKRSRLFGYLTPLLEEVNLDKVKEIFEEVLIYVYSLLHDEKPVANKGIVIKIKEYVENNYMDSTLNIGSMAEDIGKNPKYIARVFRSETQEGLLDYINGIRIKKAIVLMHTGKYSIEEIGKKVGYATSKTFRRAFVKIMGVTPGKLEDQSNQSPK